VSRDPLQGFDRDRAGREAFLARHPEPQRHGPAEKGQDLQYRMGPPALSGWAMSGTQTAATANRQNARR
jgi:hypothetical protein